MISANGHMTTAVYFLFAPSDDDDCIKATKRKASKVCNKDMTKLFATHDL